METEKNKIELITLFEGETLQYYLKVYSGSKELIFLVDTGSNISIVLNSSLKGSDYVSISLTKSISGLGGSVESKQKILEFGLTPENKNQFSLSFDSVYKKDAASIIHNTAKGCDGIIGVNFLKFCTIDFSNGYLYTNDKGTVITASVEAMCSGFKEATDVERE